MNLLKLNLYWFLTTLILLITNVSFSFGSELKVSKIFSNNMVLQRDASIPIWGFSDPNEEITIQFEGQKKTSYADLKGKWRIYIGPFKASCEPKILKVTAKNSQQEIKNVLIGDVWLCTGQSNMTVTFKEVPEEATSVERSSQIRFMTAGNVIIPVQQDVIEPFNNWVVCDDNSLQGCCRLGYYFALKLWKELGVPIGIVNISIGSSSIEAWLSPDVLAAHPNWKDGSIAEMERIQKIYINYKNYTDEEKESIFTEYFETSYGWWAKNFMKNGEIPTEAYDGIFWHMRVTQSACIYNHAVRPLVGFGIKGILWYQGETNYRDDQYAEKQQAMIEDWRKSWGQGQLPFYTVQIAPYVGGEGCIPRFWIQQYIAASKTKNTGIVSTIDISSDNQGQHPINKRDVGLRLALLALKNTYGVKGIVASGPSYKSMKVNGSKIIVLFDNVGSGLSTRDGNEPDSFEIAGEDARFYPAHAVIKGTEVEVSSNSVTKPIDVRFAWNHLANPNLKNKEGLPAFPFNTAETYFKQK